VTQPTGSINCGQDIEPGTRRENAINDGSSMLSAALICTGENDG
jgi:hypothetical protein